MGLDSRVISCPTFGDLYASERSPVLTPKTEYVARARLPLSTGILAVGDRFRAFLRTCQEFRTVVPVPYLQVGDSLTTIPGDYYATALVFLGLMGASEAARK